MALDSLRSASDSTGKGQDQRKPGTTTGSAAKGYAEHEVDGSDYNKYGNRIDYKKLAATNFK